MDDLDSLLGHLRDGGKVESSGTFTLDLRKARDKLRAYQLAEPCFYLLKLVQAGVAAGAVRLDLHLARREISVYMILDPGTRLAESGALIELLADPQSAQPGPLRHLAIGLNSSWALEPAWVSWSYWPGIALDQPKRGAWSIRIDTEEIHLQPDPPKPWEGKTPRAPEVIKEFRNFDVVEFTLVRNSNPMSYLKNTGSEHRAILYRCGFCPIPLYIDGRRLIGQWSPPLQLTERWMGGAFYAAERYVLQPGGGFRICAPPWSLLKPSEDPRTMLNPTEKIGTATDRYPTYLYRFEGHVDSSGDTLRCHCAVAIPCQMQGKSRLVLVKDGVTLEPIELTEQPFRGRGIQVIIAAPQVPTDLSEFRAMDGEEVEKSIAAARVQLLSQFDEMLAGLKGLPHHHLKDPDGDNEWVYGWLGTVFPSMAAGSSERRKNRTRLGQQFRQALQGVGSFNGAETKSSPLEETHKL